MRMDLCPNCFEPGYQNGVCGHCGYQIQYDKKRSAKSLLPGSLLKQRYYIGKLLGEGGFGITYKAYDCEKNLVCAVKEYAPNGLCRRTADQRNLELASADSEMPYMAGLRRFQDEAQILSRLEQIPSVVDITDTFQENHTAYFVMEYLDGADLRQIVKAARHRLPVDQITNIILQVAVSMDVIHAKTKIIHRDISPENIYITRDGKVKLIDFGSAKRTETGMKKGLSVVLKPKFAPPEQFSSEMLQGSFTDVYSLASTYYYALTGVNVPPAPDRLAGMAYVPLKQMNLGVPDSVSDAVDRALLLNVNQRTRTMQEFIGGIAAAGPKPRPVPPKPAPKPRPVQPGKKTAVAIPYVKVAAGPETGKNWVIPPNQTMTFGRSATEANMRIQYPENVSRIHCRITFLTKNQKYTIQDVSGNGTFYKGQRLQKGVEYQIKPPARFMLASSSCVIELGVRYEYR